MTMHSLIFSSLKDGYGHVHPFLSFLSGKKGAVPLYLDQSGQGKGQDNHDLTCIRANDGTAGSPLVRLALSILFRILFRMDGVMMALVILSAFASVYPCLCYVTRK